MSYLIIGNHKLVFIKKIKINNIPDANIMPFPLFFYVFKQIYMQNVDKNKMHSANG